MDEGFVVNSLDCVFGMLVLEAGVVGVITAESFMREGIECGD